MVGREQRCICSDMISWTQSECAIGDCFCALKLRNPVMKSIRYSQFHTGTGQLCHTPLVTASNEGVLRGLSLSVCVCVPWEYYALGLMARFSRSPILAGITIREVAVWHQIRPLGLDWPQAYLAIAGT